MGLPSLEFKKLCLTGKDIPGHAKLTAKILSLKLIMTRKI